MGNNSIQSADIQKFHKRLKRAKVLSTIQIISCVFSLIFTIGVYFILIFGAFNFSPEDILSKYRDSWSLSYVINQIIILSFGIASYYLLIKATKKRNAIERKDLNIPFIIFLMPEIYWLVRMLIKSDYIACFTNVKWILALVINILEVVFIGFIILKLYDKKSHIDKIKKAYILYLGVEVISGLKLLVSQIIIAMNFESKSEYAKLFLIVYNSISWSVSLVITTLLLLPFYLLIKVIEQKENGLEFEEYEKCESYTVEDVNNILNNLQSKSSNVEELPDQQDEEVAQEIDEDKTQEDNDTDT